MRVFRRSLVVWIALMGIVFSQLAVAAYACPELTPSAAIKQMKAMDDMAGMPCADAGMAEKVQQPALCAQHCDQGNQTVGAAQPTDFHPALVLLLVLQVPTIEALPGLLSAQAPLLARGASSPLSGAPVGCAFDISEHLAVTR